MKYLREIFDTHYPYEEVKYQYRGEHIYKFKTPHDEYTIGITKGEYPSIAFHNKDNEFSDVSNQEGRHAHRVFGTIRHIIHQHVKEHPEIKSLNFNAKKNSRIKLYNKMSKDYSQSSKDYSQYSNDDFKEYNIPVR